MFVQHSTTGQVPAGRTLWSRMLRRGCFHHYQSGGNTLHLHPGLNFRFRLRGTMLRHAIRLLTSLLVLVSLTTLIAAVFVTNLAPFPDPTGAVATFNSSGDIDGSGAFFQSLGTNGRTCATCHRLDQAMSLSNRGVQSIYRQSHGNDPLFAAVDGANCPTDDIRQRSSHSLLLDRGLIRVGLPLPSTREFSISVVRDPYGCAIIHDPNTGAETISVYRRPLPTTILRFLSAVMFDGRETILPLTDR